MSRKVAVYARVSTEHEAQINALENQIQYYDDKLMEHPDWELYDRYIDEGITGTSVNKRKNFLRMIEDAERGCFDLIITREVSRFARNTVDTLLETRKLKRIGVEVYFTEDNIWTFKDEDGELKLTLMATLAQNESKKTSQRVKAGQKISFQNGVFYGTGNILGYDKIGKDLIVNEEQAKIVKFIYSSYLSGDGTTIIANELEKLGYLTATGKKKWSASYIARVLQNPFYCGTIVYRKSYIPDFLEQKPKKNNGEVEQVIVEGKHTPIISKEDFEKVQMIIQEHSKYIEKGKKAAIAAPKSIWSKKLRCNCGSTFNRRVYHKNSDDNTYCYQCYHQKNIGSTKYREKQGLDLTDSCDIPIVQEWKLKLMATVIFNSIWHDKNQIIDLANQLIDEVITEDESVSEIDSNLKRLSIRIDNTKSKIDKLLNMYLDSLIDQGEYIEKKKEFEEELNKYKESKEKLESERGIPKETLELRLKNLKKNIIFNLNYMENTISDSLIDTFVEKITVRKDVFEWKLNYLNDMNNEITNNVCKNDEDKENDKGIFLTRVIVTKDNAMQYIEFNQDYKNIRGKTELIADIYI